MVNIIRAHASSLEENAAIVDKDRLLDKYHTAIHNYPYPFFFANLSSKDVNIMFYTNVQSKF